MEAEDRVLEVAPVLVPDRDRHQDQDHQGGVEEDHMVLVDHYLTGTKLLTVPMQQMLLSVNRSSDRIEEVVYLVGSYLELWQPCLVFAHQYLRKMTFPLAICLELETKKFNKLLLSCK